MMRDFSECVIVIVIVIVFLRVAALLLRSLCSALHHCVHFSTTSAAVVRSELEGLSILTSCTATIANPVQSRTDTDTFDALAHIAFCLGNALSMSVSGAQPLLPNVACHISRPLSSLLHPHQRCPLMREGRHRCSPFSRSLFLSPALSYCLSFSLFLCWTAHRLDSVTLPHICFLCLGVVVCT